MRWSATPQGKINQARALPAKLFSQLCAALAGGHYIHYAFGLLDRTNVFCPVQAVLDNEHIGMIKRFLRKPGMDGANLGESVSQIRKVMASNQKLYARFVRKGLRTGQVYSHYPFESRDGDDNVIAHALGRMHELLARPGKEVPLGIEEEIFATVPGLLPRLKRKNE